MSDDEEYEYPDEDDTVIDEDYPEDDDEYAYVEEDEDTPSPRPGGKKLAPPKPGGCLRQTSTSYQMVVPKDSYVLHTASEIRPLLDALIDEVRNLLQVSSDEAQLLLQYCQWDKEKLMEKYFSNMDKIRAEAGIDMFQPDFLQAIASIGQDALLAGEEEETIECFIGACDEPVIPKSQSIGLGCEHFFCKECYTNYLENVKADGPSCITSRCPMPKCTQIVPGSYFHALLNPEDAERYDEYVLRNFVERSKTMKYCPAPRCDKISVGSGITTIHCSCQTPYCFKCGENAHDPCSCKQLNQWNIKNSNDGETANWLLINTKKCPKCKADIQKNDGCNHMTCAACKHHFCWICLGKLSLLLWMTVV